nr:hypothetical protein [Tanacetum cinerariifolium]
MDLTTGSSYRHSIFVNEFLATFIDFSVFINRLKIDNLTQEVLTSSTYNLIKGTCKSVVELEYHLEEVFKATNDQLDWYNSKWKPYPHDLSKSIPLIQDERDIQKNLYNAFVKSYNSDKDIITSYGDVVTLKRGRDDQDNDEDPSVGSNRGSKKRRHKIIAITSLKIMEWFSYHHLEDIIIRRQDDKLSNLNLEERYALNVALRMFTRRIGIQELVKDLQLGVESYQKKINLTRNRLMRTDKLYKFSVGTLNHVHTALNDIATGIKMEYIPKRK